MIPVTNNYAPINKMTVKTDEQLNNFMVERDEAKKNGK
jgi:hypothetical protein